MGSITKRGAGALLIFPCNGNALEALNCLVPAHHFLGFVDDTPEKQGVSQHGHPVFTRAAFDKWPQAQVLAVAGSALTYRTRRAVIDGLGLRVDRFASVIHPRAVVSPLASIGRNTVIMAGVVITSNAMIGDHVIVLPNTVIHHDVSIGSWSLIGSNVTVAGNTHIGENCYVASGSSVMNGLNIGDGALIGLGSTVLRSVSAAVRVAGNPARLLL